MSLIYKNLFKDPKSTKNYTLLKEFPKSITMSHKIMLINTP